MTPEKIVQNSILKRLKDAQKSNPIFFERRQAGGFSYKKGIPDIYAVYDGQHIEIEVKRPGGKMSTMQEKFAEMCKKNHIFWMCVSSVEEFDTNMNIIKNQIKERKNLS